MRKVRNHGIHSGNPGLMFAQGIESMVRDHVTNPRHQDELQEKRKSVVIKPQTRGNFFGLLMRQFASH